MSFQSAAPPRPGEARGSLGGREPFGAVVLWREPRFGRTVHEGDEHGTERHFVDAMTVERFDAARVVQPDGVAPRFLAQLASRRCDGRLVRLDGAVHRLPRSGGTAGGATAQYEDLEPGRRLSQHVDVDERDAD